MNSAVCTLFEGHYHYGVAALINSLYKHDFRGTIYVGYRGLLPNWCTGSFNNPALSWPGGSTLEIKDSLCIHWLPIEVDYHLANYKPEFMLRLLAGPANGTEDISYFDPDIVIKCDWSFYKKWMNYGIALVHEVIANDMPESHPIRLEWNEIISKIDKKVVHTLNSYINSGFCGISSKQFDFLNLWAKIMHIAEKDYKIDMKTFIPYNRLHPFHGTDQDALNIAAMCCDGPVSEVGPDGMDFIGGGWLMSHAVGSPKPWKKNFLLSALKGYPPTLPERTFWANAAGPIVCYSNIEMRVKKLNILLAAFIGRFYQRY